MVDEGICIVGVKNEGVKILNISTAVNSSSHTNPSCKSTKMGGVPINGMCHTNGWLITLDDAKNCVKFYDGKNKDVCTMVSTTPEKLGALCGTSSGEFLIGGGSSGTCYIWSLHSGVLLGVWKAHYRGIVCLNVLDDDSMIVSAGEDGMIHVWNLADVLDKEGPMVRSRYSLKGHTLAVSGICTGNFGCSSRIASSSLDHSVKLWTIDGSLLETFVLPGPATCVCMDVLETWIFAGGEDGTIRQFPLRQDLQWKPRLFEGHSSSVTCVKLTLTGLVLVSTSLDSTCRLWDVFSSQLLSVVHFTKPVTSVLLCQQSDISGGDPCKPLLRYQGRTENIIEVSLSVQRGPFI